MDTTAFMLTRFFAQRPLFSVSLSSFSLSPIEKFDSKAGAKDYAIRFNSPHVQNSPDLLRQPVILEGIPRVNVMSFR